MESRLFRSNAFLGRLSTRRFRFFDDDHDIVKHVRDREFLHYRVVEGGDHVAYLLKNSNKTEKNGLKFHVNIDPNDLERVWPKLLDIFLVYQVDYFKVVRPDLFEQADDDRYTGKQITIYTYANKEKSVDAWYEIIKVIEKMLIAEGCQPGRLHPANKMIMGSRFISYRNDRHPDPDKIYISDIDAAAYAAGHPGVEAHNPCGAPDLFADFDISKNRYTFGGY
jgi:hypothetical protein